GRCASHGTFGEKGWSGAGDSVMRPIAAVAGTPALACGGAGCSGRCAAEWGTVIAATAAIIARYANARLRLCIDIFPLTRLRAIARRRPLPASGPRVVILSRRQSYSPSPACGGGFLDEEQQINTGWSWRRALGRPSSR